MALGINVTMLLSALCYLMLIPTALALLSMKQHEPISVPI
jgi:hypothetical protein